MRGCCQVTSPTILTDAHLSWESGKALLLIFEIRLDKRLSLSHRVLHGQSSSQGGRPILQQDLKEPSATESAAQHCGQIMHAMHIGCIGSTLLAQLGPL